MDRKSMLRLNTLINNAYECGSFIDFLRLAILELHKSIHYDSGMFYCAISHDCSYFKPYQQGDLQQYYTKQEFAERESYLEYAKGGVAGKEAYVYKPIDYVSGLVQVTQEPRKYFLQEQEAYHIACLRIVYKGQFLGEIYLHREKSKPDFSDEDMLILNLLQPHISTIFHMIHQKTANQAVEQLNRLTQIGLCAFDKDFNMISANVSGLEMLKNVTNFGSNVLHHLKELGFEMAGRKNKKHDNTSEILQTNHGSIRAELLGYPTKKSEGVCFIGLLEYLNADQGVADYRLKFTKREADIIDGLIQGKSNAQLASSLSLSENTVKTHIKHIYSKTGVSNRIELTYLLMARQ